MVRRPPLDRNAVRAATEDRVGKAFGAMQAADSQDEPAQADHEQDENALLQELAELNQRQGEIIAKLSQGQQEVAAPDGGQADATGSPSAAGMP